MPQNRILSASEKQSCPYVSEIRDMLTFWEARAKIKVDTAFQKTAHVTVRMSGTPRTPREDIPFKPSARRASSSARVRWPSSDIYGRTRVKARRDGNWSR